MNTTPKVSVIMPSLNVGPYIRECIDSVVNQTLREIEIICVDAGSTDGTLEVLEEYAAKDDRITIIHSDKKSYGYQMNVGFAAARGEYIGIVETDDYIKPEMYEKLCSIADQYEVDVLKADLYRFVGDGDDRKFTYLKMACEKALYNRVIDPKDELKVFKSNYQTQTGVYRLSFIRNNNIVHNETPGASFQDLGFKLQTISRASKYMFIPDAFYMLRRDNPNSSVKDTAKVYAAANEHDWVRERLSGSENEQSFAPAFAMQRMGAYEFTLTRIAPEFVQEFLVRYANDFRKLQNNGELNRSLFSNAEWKRLHEIMECPDYVYYRDYYQEGKLGKDLEATRKKANRLSREINDIRASRSYKIGRLITWLPRKLRGGLRCLRDHGFKYTFNRALIKLHIKPAQVVKDYNYYYHLAPKKYPQELKLWFKKATGNDLDLDIPKTFNEKIQWMKLYDATPLKTRLADKYLVRDWVKEKIGEEYLIPLLGVWDSFDEIDFDKLPNRFALKANHGSGWNIIVKDKSQLDKADAKKKFDTWIKKNYAFNNGFELQYMNIPPKIIAEEYIENVEGLKDYRFYCFNGKPQQVWVDIFSGTPKHLRSVYDMEWNLLPLKCTWPEGGKLLSEKPKTFEKMKKFAALLSKDFAFVRVDFFDVDGKLYMGEMTFTPMTGAGKFEPLEWDRKLGDMLTLPPKSPIPTRQR